MRTIRLITCNDAFQAQVIQGALEHEGIASVLHNVNTSNVLRGFDQSISGVDIFVYEDEYSKAITLLEQNQMIPEQLKHCPYCHSDDIRFVLKKGKRIRAALATLLSMLTAAPPGTEHWEYICNRCGTHFDTPVAKTSRNEAPKKPASPHH